MGGTMKWPKFEQFNLKLSTILLGYMGSHSHGTYIPPVDDGIDDKDVMGICVPPKEYFLGLSKFEQCDTWVDEYDIVIYEVRKFIRLLLKNNPNVMGLLWLRPQDYIKITPQGQKLIDNRSVFASKQAFYSFTGYANGQLKRMTHYKFEGYMGEKRKKLVDRYGFDTKNAAHLIRLLRMGAEFLRTEQLNVFRNDADELINIKQGGVKLSEIKSRADELLEDARDAYQNSSLPLEPNYEKAEKILIEVIEDTL